MHPCIEMSAAGHADTGNETQDDDTHDEGRHHLCLESSSWASHRPVEEEEEKETRKLVM